MGSWALLCLREERPPLRQDNLGESMFTNNPFAALTDFLSPLTVQVYALLMIAAVIFGTLFDAYHKGSMRYFALRRQKSTPSRRCAASGAS